jgi:hypothetical protein
MATKTIRQLWIEEIYRILREMTYPEEGTVWQKVLRSDLEDIDVTELPACAVDEGDEERLENMFPFVQKCTKIFIEFRFENKRGTDPYDKFNFYLGLLQKALFNDRTLGGYAYNIDEIGNSPRIVDRGDTRPGGVLMLEIYWKVRNTDPYTNT